MKLQPIWVMLRIGFLVVMFIGCYFFAQAQNPLVKQWDKRFGGASVEFLYSILQTSDGGYILGGYSYSNISGDKTQNCWGNKDYWIVKTDLFGNKQWDRDFGGSQNDYLITIQQTSDGGYILGGYSDSNISGVKTQNSWGLEDYWIVKTDSLGIKQWDKDFGGSGFDELYSIQQTLDGGYILGGSSSSNIGGDKTQNSWGADDYWIVKTDSLGNKQWDKDFGGVSYDVLLSILQTSDGGYIFGGESSSNISGDKTQNSWGGSDYWIVKTDSLGNKQWDKDFGGSQPEALYSIQQTSDSGYILSGPSLSNISGDKTQNNWGDWDYWIVKIDSLGNMLWDKDFGGSSSDVSSLIQQTSDNGFLISGESISPISGDKTENNLGFSQTWVVKTDSLGNKQWDKTIFTNGADEQGKGIQTKDGCYVFANTTNAGIGGYKTQASQGNYDYWIVKFCDSTATFIPSINLSSSDTTFCEKHCIDFYDLSTNNPTSWQWFFPGSDSLTSTLQNPTNICYNQYGSFDVTLIACNAAGCDTLVLPRFINEYQTLTPSITQSNDTLFSSPGVAYQWWSVDSGIITGAANSYYIPTQGGSYYVIVTDSNGCEGASNTIVIMGIEEARGKGQMAIVPNPNNGTFTISLNDIIGKDFSISIINAMGQTINNCHWSIVNGQKATVNLSNAAKGLYVVEVINDGKVYRARFIVE